MLRHQASGDVADLGGETVRLAGLRDERDDGERGIAPLEARDHLDRADVEERAVKTVERVGREGHDAASQHRLGEAVEQVVVGVRGVDDDQLHGLALLPRRGPVAPVPPKARRNPEFQGCVTRV